MSRPLVFGYVAERVDGPPAPVPLSTSLSTLPSTWNRPASLGLFFDETAIARFAAREGFELVHLYRDRAPDAHTPPQRNGFHATVEAIQWREGIAAVVVVDVSHLGSDAAGQAEARRQIESGTGVPLLTVRLLQPSGSTRR